jgi:hypothetical protein
MGDVIRFGDLRVGNASRMLHVAVAWMLLVGSFSIVGLAAYVLTLRLPSLPESAAVMIALVIVVGVTTAVIGVALFSVAWFGYLRGCITAGKREWVEESLKQYMQVQLMEPIYGKAKGLVYGSFRERA